MPAATRTSVCLLGFFLLTRSLTLGADLFSMDGRDGSHSFHRQFQLRCRILAPFAEPYYKNRLFFTGTAVSGQAVIHRATGGNNA